MIADVAFDVPLSHPFSYRVPDGWALAPGQRVVAPLRGGERMGVVVALRDGTDADLRAVTRLAEPSPALGPRALDLARWIADESLSSLGSTLAALLPPPPLGAGAEATRRGGEVTVLTGTGRERRLLDRLESAPGVALVITADVEAAARWGQRLARLGPVARLDSGVADTDRADAWRRVVRGEARLAVGTRSALLLPLGDDGVVGLVDEHEAAHKPPGPPRLHSRDVVVARAAREAAAAFLTSATPSAETWQAIAAGRARLAAAAPAPWPAVIMADTRGILRREPLTPPLARAVRETMASGRRALLVVSRLASALACDECGTVLRCPECALALTYLRARPTLECRVCGRDEPMPTTCPSCAGRRLTPFGWGIERVEHAVRRRFPDARIARFDPEATRGARGAAQRAAASEASIVVGTRGALRLFGPGALGVVGFVSPDQLLRAPDFRAGERLFALLWAAAERVVPDGAVVVQTHEPTHYAFAAAARQDLAAFYDRELGFRRELGYPPFRRLAVVSVTGGGADGKRLAENAATALRAAGRVTVYPPVADRRDRQRRVVVKGDADLPAILRAALADLRAPRPKSRGIIDVEVDPVEWRF